MYRFLKVRTNLVELVWWLFFLIMFPGQSEVDVVCSVFLFLWSRQLSEPGNYVHIWRCCLLYSKLLDLFEPTPSMPLWIMDAWVIAALIADTPPHGSYPAGPKLDRKQHIRFKFYWATTSLYEVMLWWKPKSTAQCKIEQNLLYRFWIKQKWGTTSKTASMIRFHPGKWINLKVSWEIDI